MNDLELGWLCGIIDGEGCFTIRTRTHQTKNYGGRTTFYAQLVVSNTDANIVKRCRDLTGIGRVYTRDRPFQLKTMHQWRAGSKDLREIIPLLKRYCLKSREIEIVERVLEINATRRIRPEGGSGAFRTDDEKLELVKLRKELINLHGDQAKSLAKKIEPNLLGSTPLRADGYQVSLEPLLEVAGRIDIK